MIKVNWPRLRQEIIGNNLAFNYVRDDNSYTITVYNGLIELQCTIPTKNPPSTEQLDFETNFLSNANQLIVKPQQQRLTLDFISTTGVTSSGKAYELPYFLLLNTSSNSKSARIKRIRFSSPGNGTSIFRVFLGSTITADGTALGISSMNGSVVSTMETFVLPSVSANGSEIESFNVQQNDVEWNLDYSLWIVPGNNLMITSHQSLAGGSSKVTIIFGEES